MYVHCIEMYIYVPWAICQLVVLSYTIKDEAVNPINPQEIHCFKWNSVFDLHYIFWNVTLA